MVAVVSEAEVGSGFSNFDVIVLHEIHCVANPGSLLFIVHRPCLSGEEGSAEASLYLGTLDECVDKFGCKCWYD